MIGKAAVENAYGWAQPVYSPVHGTVVAASDGWPDRQTLHLAWDALHLFVRSVLQAQKVRDDLRLFAGNYIIIASEGCYVLLAHLRKGSLLIAAGQNVSQGQPLARVGNSGNSLAPHLHLQVNAGPDLLASAIQPFAFTQYFGTQRLVDLLPSAIIAPLMYKIALMTRRIARLRGRPPVFAAGTLSLI